MHRICPVCLLSILFVGFGARQGLGQSPRPVGGMGVRTPSLGQPFAQKPLLGGSNVEAALENGERDVTGIQNHLTHRLEDLPPPESAPPLPRYRRMQASGPRPKPFSVDHYFITRSNVDNANTSVAMSQLGVNYQARFPFSDAFQLTLRPLFNVLFLSGPGGPYDLPPQLYTVAVDVQGDIHINEWLGFSAGLTPGIWTDFDGWNSNTFRLPARLLATFRIQDDLFVAAGAIYTDNLQHNAFPAGGLIWDPSEKIRVELLFPRSRVVYKLQENWQVYGVLEGYGNTYSIRSTIGGVTYNEQFLYRDLRLMLGTQVDFFERVSLFAEMGAVMDRKMKFDTSLQPTNTVDPGFIIRFGTRF